MTALDAARGDEPGPVTDAEEPDLPNGHAPKERLSRFLARRIQPTTEDEREALVKQFADLLFAHGLRTPDSTKAVIAFKEVLAGFRRHEPVEAARSVTE